MISNYEFVQIRPATLGKNIAAPPRVIDQRSSPDLMNVRFSYGQLQSRAGFKGKYFGCASHPLSISSIYTFDGSSQVIAAFCLSEVNKQIPSTNIMTPIQAGVEITASADTNTSTTIDNISGWTPGYDINDVIVGSLIWDAAGDIPASTTVVGVDHTAGTITLSQAATGSHSTTISVAGNKPFTTSNSDNFSIDIGEGTYTSRIFNGGTIFPSTGYGAITAFSNGVDGVFVAFIGDSAPHSGILVCGKIYDSLGVGLVGAKAVCFFDNRLIVGGTSNSSSEILWSGVSAFDDFSSVGSGSLILGDSIDWIQAIRTMGEFLIVYKERSIYIGQKSGKVDPAVVFSLALGQGVGIAAPETIGDLGGEHIFLGHDNVYVFSDKGITPIGDPVIDEILGTYGDRGIIPAHIKRCVGGIVEEFKEYWLLVPTGKFPEVTNLLARPMMDFIKVLNADFTNGSSTLTNIDQGEINYVKLGDTIIHTSIAGGSAKIIGIPHTSSTVAANSIEMNELATATHVNHGIIAGNTDNWAAVGDSNYSWSTIVGGGNLGGIYQSISFTLGTYVVLYTDTLVDIGTTGNRYISVICFVNGNVSGKLEVGEFSAAGAYLNQVHSVDFVSASTSFSLVTLSFTCVDITCRKLKILIYNETINENMGIDGVQVCDLTSVPQEFIYNYNGYGIPGYKGAFGELYPIPFFVGTIGPWILDTAWVYNYQLNSWSCWRLPVTGFGYDTISSSFSIADLTGTVKEQLWRYDDKRLDDLSPSNLIGSCDGQIYEMSTAYSRDYEGYFNEAIITYWQSKDFDLGKPELDKTVSRLIINHEVSHPNTSITVSISTDSGVSWLDQTIVIRQGYTETYADFFVTGPQFRFKVQTTGVLKITGFVVKVITRGETNAY
jgi:hypothetical protein